MVAMEEEERQGSVVVMYGDLSLSLPWLSTYLYSLRRALGIPQYRPYDLREP
jgi:hypothetical protein